MSSNYRDILGERGETIFRFLINKFHTGRGFLFRTQFLGDKWPCVDCIVELVNAGNTTPYFFVQVKATQQGYTGSGRLKVQVTSEKVCELARYPAPTYIVGIDETKAKGYIISANGENDTAVSSLSIRFPINKRNREKLWKEVKDFWDAYPNANLDSKFNDEDWR
jgi:hypothetical protein